jgi:DNA-binding MarR family transcriptional regulator
MGEKNIFTVDDRRRKKWMALLQEMHPEVDPELVRLMDDLRQTAHSLRLISEGSLISAGLSYAKFRLLMSLLISEELDGGGSLNPSEISSQQGTSRNTISALIKDLEDESLLVRELDQDDRRKFNIRLTDAGRIKVKLHASNHFKTIAACFDSLNDHERQIMSEAMVKIRQSAIKTTHDIRSNIQG